MLQFEVDEETGRKVRGLIGAGRRGRIIVTFAARDIVSVEVTEAGVARGSVMVTNTFPTATGVFIVRS